MADAHRRRRQPESEGDAALAGRSGALFDGGLDGRPQVVGPQVEQDEPGIELGQLEQVLGQPVQPFDLLTARFEELGASIGIVAGPFPEEVVEGSQGGEWCPQLVRDVGEEITASVAVAADDLDALLHAIRHRIELDRELGHLR